MAAPLKCPNPSCPFLFDPTQVPADTSLACPRCGMRFMLGSQQTNLTPDTKPEVPKTKRKKVEEPVEEEMPKSSKRSVIAVGTVLSLIIIGVITTLFVLKYKDKIVVDNGKTGGVVYAKFGLVLQPPTEADGWEKNDKLQSDYGATLFAYNRTGKPEGNIIGDARRYPYAARPSDLRERVREHLGKQFDEIPLEPKGEPCEFLGKPALKYQMRALSKLNQEELIVDVYSVAHGTLAVWLIAFSDKSDYTAMQDSFNKIRDSLSIGKVETINVTPPTPRSHRSRSGRFLITDYEGGIWGAPLDDPKSQDEYAELWMRGTARSTIKSECDLVVNVMPLEGEAASIAESHILKSLSAGFEYETINGEPIGDAPLSGELKQNTDVKRLKVTYKNALESSNKFIVYGYFTSGDKLVLAYTLCRLSEREYWEQKMMQMVGSMKSTK